MIAIPSAEALPARCQASTYNVPPPLPGVLADHEWPARQPIAQGREAQESDIGHALKALDSSGAPDHTQPVHFGQNDRRDGHVITPMHAASHCLVVHIEAEAAHLAAKNTFTLSFSFTLTAVNGRERKRERERERVSVVVQLMSR
jgi:hypothetical protein